MDAAAMLPTSGMTGGGMLPFGGITDTGMLPTMLLGRAAADRRHALQPVITTNGHIGQSLFFTNGSIITQLRSISLHLSPSCPVLVWRPLGQARGQEGQAG